MPAVFSTSISCSSKEHDEEHGEEGEAEEEEEEDDEGEEDESEQDDEVRAHERKAVAVFFRDEISGKSAVTPVDVVLPINESIGDWIDWFID